jgi:hypothetical protein
MTALLAMGTVYIGANITDLGAFKCLRYIEIVP